MARHRRSNFVVLGSKLGLDMSIDHDARGDLCLGGVSLPSLAVRIGTPAYVYDLDAIAAEARQLREGFDDAPHLVAYAVKANTAGAVVRALARSGCGADVVSGAELLVALGCGISPSSVVYSGVAKRDDELDMAISCEGHGIGAIQLESVEEIARVESRARSAGRRARVSIRLNPGVDLTHATHAHIATGHDAAKFGVLRPDVRAAVRRIEDSRHLELVGMSTHVGSQFTSTQPYVDGARALFDLVRELRGDGALRSLRFVNTGGGFGIDYGAPEGARAATPPRPAEFVRAARAEQRAFGLGDLALYVEPGRCLVAPHGALLARVIQVKVTAVARWLLIDAGMNDLLRPALYQARHRVVPLRAPSSREGEDEAGRRGVPWRVVGPVCESSDDFGEHLLPAEPPLAVAILDAGAYGYTMANVYNGRQLPAEAFVSGGDVTVKGRTSVDAWVDDRVGAGPR